MLKKLFFLLFCCSSYAHEPFIDLESFEDQKIITATKRIFLDDFPGATNPSIIKTEDGIIMIFRYTPDPYYDATVSYIGLVMLNENLDVISEPQILNTRSKNSKTPSQSEDARLFSYRGKIYIIYNDNIDVVAPGLQDRRDMFMAELIRTGDHYSLSSPLKLYCEEKMRFRIWEKNWVPFEYNKMLLLGYTIAPHEILYPNLKSGECYPSYETFNCVDWGYGILRGSSAPILVDGEYLAFFHSGAYLASEASWGRNLWHYFMGAYTFSAQPPFHITKISQRPIIAKGFYTHANYIKRIIFPGGYIVCGDTIYMAYGKDDQEIWIATINKEELMKSLSPVEKL